MNMIFRWYGSDNDPIKLSYIKQIPGTKGIAWALHDIPAGEVWPLERILEVKKEAEDAGLHIETVESVNVHEEIKLGLPGRDHYIANYKQTIINLAAAGVKVVCYNFMPVFDWTRTNLFKEMDDGSTALFYEHSRIEEIDPFELARTISGGSLSMPGWEPERLEQLGSLFEAYKEVTEEHLWSNLAYFLQEIIPTAAEHGIAMAIHPDDPPWSVFGLPRIINSQAALRRLLSLHDHSANGLALCSGSLGANPENDIVSMIYEFRERIHFAHIRNVRVYENGDFIETSHRTEDGSVNIAGIVKAYHDIGYTGYARPDHGRHIWGEECRPGYGLYDRGLGIMHIWGLWDAYRYAAEQQSKGVL